MEKHKLSKSTFIRGVQCLKSLYLNKKRPFLRDRLPVERLIVFRRGHNVGELARQLFPGGIDTSPGHPSAYSRSVLMTKQKTAEASPVIYEAGFQYDGVLVFLDILVKEDGGWHAYEVKSSRSVSETYLTDAALQYYVIRGSGLPLNGISIIHIDDSYVREGEIDVHKLFAITDVTAEALAKQGFIREQVLKEKETLDLPHAPAIDVGPHCREPYDCDFIGHCWKNIPVDEVAGSAGHFDMKALETIKSRIRGPVAFAKALSIRPAIPLYQGTRPYQELSFAMGLLAEDAAQPVSMIIGKAHNPEPQLAPAIRKNISGVQTIICLGQERTMRRILGDDIQIVDISMAFSAGSGWHSTRDGESLLRNIGLAAGRSEAGITRKYTSDAICESDYLEHDPNPELMDSLTEYLQEWTLSMRELWNYIFNLPS